jgi:hypothetical protein
VAAPATTELSDLEREFGEQMTALTTGIVAIQDVARRLREAGGDPRDAFLACFPASEQAQVAAYWPMLSILFT